MSRLVAKFDRFPKVIRRKLLSLFVGRMVPFVGTASLKIEEMNTDQVIISIANRRKVQNHIHSLHAAAMALYVRYLKRINSHLRNIASSVVNPFDHISFNPQHARH